MQNACASRVCDCVRSCGVVCMCVCVCVCVCVCARAKVGVAGRRVEICLLCTSRPQPRRRESGAVPMEKTAHAELQANVSLMECLCLARQREKTRSKRGWRETIASDLAVYSMCSHHDSYGGHQKCRLVSTVFVVTWLPGRNPRQEEDCPHWEHTPCPIASCGPVETAPVSACAAL